MRNAIRWVLAILALCGWGCSAAPIGPADMSDEDSGALSEPDSGYIPPTMETRDAMADVVTAPTVEASSAVDAGSPPMADTGSPEDSDASPGAVAPSLSSCPALVPNSASRSGPFAFGSGQPECYSYIPTEGAAPSPPEYCCETVCPFSPDALKALECAFCKAMAVPGRPWAGGATYFDVCPSQVQFIGCSPSTQSWCAE
jgi:hypothetical protein